MFVKQYDSILSLASGNRSNMGGVGLHCHAMNRSFGGNQPNMRRTLIEKNEGYLGPYHDPNNTSMVQVGQFQEMTFGTDDKGPFWMKPDEVQNRRMDITVPETSTTRFKTKKTLLSELLNRNYPQPGVREHPKLSDLQEASQSLVPPLEIKLTTNKIICGWEDKPKGLLQVLWERG